jgi:hypothetical protein
LRAPVTAEDLEAAVCLVTAMLSEAIDADWSVPAGSLDWSCAETITHTAQVGVHYAAQLATQAETGHVRVMCQPHPAGTNAHLLQFFDAGGHLLAAAVRAAAANARAFHAYGTADPEGWAAMGCVEFLVHGADIAAGLGRPFEPDEHVCQRVLARLFPDHESVLRHHDIDSRLGLHYATGRAQVPGLPVVDQWRWHSAPLDSNVAAIAVSQQ